MNTILLSAIIAFILIFAIFAVILLSHKCKPHCSGIYCGQNSSNGCGGICDCKEGGICQNGKCCYPNCKGVECGPDGCGGTCKDKCVAIPNGVCITGPKGDKCCYAQECDSIFCGDNGCGGTCGCKNGANCSTSTGSGICVNSSGGKPDWVYSVAENRIIRANFSSPNDCAQWIPKNPAITLKNFPCKTDSDCPYEDTCIKDKTGNSFCNRNNVYRYWYYDPTDPSGFNCTKILQGSKLCGFPKPGTYGFDIQGNVGPDAVQCGKTCDITAKGDIAEITSVCDPSVLGGSLQVNQNTIGNFTTPDCKSVNQMCNYNSNGVSFQGSCQQCLDGSLKCFPNSMCIPNSGQVGKNAGTCSPGNIC